MNSIRQRIDSTSMGAYQWIIVAVCILLNAQDGFDISAVAYGSTGITEEFGLTGTELGTVISAGLLGIVIGAFVLAPFADRFGRRFCIQLGLGLTAIGMFMCAVADSPVSLTVWRFIIGIGIGGVTASINVVVAEYTSPRWRAAGIGIYTAGFGIGATVGGLAAAGLLETFGWRSIFVIGGINSVVSMILTFVLLPESIEFLAARKGQKALGQINRILKRLRYPSISQVEDPTVETEGQSVIGLPQQIGMLLNRTYRSRTVLLWVGFFTAMFAFYFLSGWTPRLSNVAGHSETTSALVGSILSIGGSIGAVAFGIIIVKTRGTLRMLSIFTTAGGIVFVILGLSMSNLSMLFVFGFLAGLLSNGVFVGLFTLAPELYPSEIRVTGVGWANGIGRTGSMLAPLAVGLLMDAAVPIALIYSFGGVLLFITAVVTAAYARAQSRSQKSRLEPVLH